MADHVLAITRIHGVAGRRGDLRALMSSTAASVVSEPGCRQYLFSAALEDPDEYVHVQEWDSEAAFGAHQSSDAFSDYQRALFELLARPSDMVIDRVASSVIPAASGLPDPRAAD